MAMVCCLACSSQPTIFISASFVPSLFGWIPQSLLGPLWGRRRYDISNRTRTRYPLPLLRVVRNFEHAKKTTPLLVVASVRSKHVHGCTVAFRENTRA